METLNIDFFTLKDQLNKCRCCFRILIDEQKIVKVTKSIEKNFHDLTQIKLIDATVFSDKICQLCYNDLEVFSQFRRDLIIKQNALYRAAKKHPDSETNLYSVKAEINEFIDCNPSAGDELLEEEVFCNPECLIKSEADETQEDYLSEVTDNKSHVKTHVYRFQVKSNEALRELCSVTQNSKMEFYQCDVCSHRTFEKFEMEVHVRSHVQKESQNFFCEFCSKEFDKRHMLNRHIKLKHTKKERNHFCPNCSKSFYTISTLKKHVESHRAKNMPCEFCGKLFSCMNNLRTHLYYHQDPKFKCEFEGCGKKFFMRKLLRAHMNVHRGQKDYACGYCEKCYFFQSHLKRHILSTHMKLKIDCEVSQCSSSFARKETYRNHVLQHHQNIGPTNLELLLTKIREMKVEEYRCVG